MKRRGFLAALGSGALASTAGCAVFQRQFGGGGGGGAGIGPNMVVGGPESFSVNPGQYADRFDRVLNAVDDLGADPSGEEPIGNVLNQGVRSGTLLVFPRGEYKMNRPFRHTGGSGNIGIIGTGGAVIRHGQINRIRRHTVVAGEYSGRTILFHLGSSTNPHDGLVLFGGFHFDFTHKHAGMQMLNSWVRGRHIVESLRQVGEHSSGSHGPLRLGTLSEESYGTYRNLDLSPGGRHPNNTINPRTSPLSCSGITIGPAQLGTMRFHGVACGGFPDNGLYIKGGTDSGPIGRKVLNRFLAKNSHVSSVRTNSGPDWEPIPEFDGSADTPAEGYENSVIENGLIVVDRQPDGDGEYFWNQIGLRVDGGRVSVRSVAISLQQPTGTGIHVQADAGGTELRSVTLDLHERERAIHASTQDVIAENVNINAIGFDPTSGLASGGFRDAAGVALERAQSATIGGGGISMNTVPSGNISGEGLQRFYINGPPNRDGRRIDATDFGSLQAAHDALQPGDTLYIPESGGPYTDRINLSRNPTNHITIASDGATIEQPNTRESFAIGSSRPDFGASTSLAGPVAAGDRVISVADTSGIQPGDDVRIREERRPWGEPPSGGATGPSFTEEFRQVVGKEGNQIALHYPVLLPYPGEASTDVSVVDWSARDIAITGLNFRGITGAGNDSIPLRLDGIRDGWIQNLTFLQAGRHCITINQSMHCRADTIEMYDNGGYGLTVQNGSSHMLFSNIVGDDIGNYTVRAGRSAVDILIDGMVGRNYKFSPSPVAASHWGSSHILYRNVVADGEQVVRFRTSNMTVTNFEVTGCTSNEVVWRQRPFNVTLANGRIGGYPPNANPVIFNFGIGGPSRHGNEATGNVTIRNIQIEDNGHPITAIGSFHSNAVVDGLHIENVVFGGQRLRREHVQQWDGYNQADISGLTVQ